MYSIAFRLMIPEPTLTFLCAPLVVQGAQILGRKVGIPEFISRALPSQFLAVGSQPEQALTAHWVTAREDSETDEPWAHIDPTVHLPIF